MIMICLLIDCFQSFTVTGLPYYYSCCTFSMLKILRFLNLISHPLLPIASFPFSSAQCLFPFYPSHCLFPFLFCPVPLSLPLLRHALSLRHLVLCATLQCHPSSLSSSLNCSICSSVSDAS